MKTKLQLLLIACFTIFSLSAMAQTKSNEDIAKNLTDKMTKSLSLSQDQANKIEAINKDYVDKYFQLKKQYANNRTEMERQIKENNADREVKSRKIFNDKQYSDYLRKITEFQVR